MAQGGLPVSGVVCNALHSKPVKACIVCSSEAAGEPQSKYSEMEDLYTSLTEARKFVELGSDVMQIPLLVGQLQSMDKLTHGRSGVRLAMFRRW